MEAIINNRFVILSDTDNDISCIKHTFEYIELLINNDFVDDLSGLSIVHTGDFLDKKAPNLDVLDYFKELQKTVHTRNGHVKILAGNHEQEIWSNIINGEDYSLPKTTLDSLRTFIETLDLFYLQGPLLFIHSYPTVEFLRELLQYREAKGKHPNSFNEDHYKTAFQSVLALSQYSYKKGNRDETHLLYDPLNAANYYRRNRSELTSLLMDLEIGCIIHGHRPQSSGKQVDREFAKCIPGIRMIGNDTKVKQNGIGATLVRMEMGRALDLAFINSSTAIKKNRKRTRYLLRPSVPGSSVLQQQERAYLHDTNLEKQLEQLTLQHNAQLATLENELQEQKTSSLFLQEDLQDRNDLYQKSLDRQASLKDTIQQLESELKKKNQQHGLAQALGDEQPLQSSSANDKPSENQRILNAKLERLKLSKTNLQEALEKSNHIRKQAVDYLRLSYNANQKLEQKIERCRHGKLEVERALQAIQMKVHSLEQQSQLERPHWLVRFRVALVCIILSGVILFYLLQ